MVVAAATQLYRLGTGQLPLAGRQMRMYKKLSCKELQVQAVIWSCALVSGGKVMSRVLGLRSLS